jgi:hypothetical protein
MAVSGSRPRPETSEREALEFLAEIGDIVLH